VPDQQFDGMAGVRLDHADWIVAFADAFASLPQVMTRFKADQSLLLVQESLNELYLPQAQKAC